MTVFSRRKMITGAAAATATVVGAANLTAPAAAATDEDRALFITLSAALTGIDKERLAPSVDPVQINRHYFDQAQRDPAFDRLMQIIRDDPSNSDAAADKIMNNADPKIRYLGRSIILAWYLGIWYDPGVLEGYNKPGPQVFPVPPKNVVSGAAYTQGWTWRVAQTHPMGYSEWVFGYWSSPPPALNDFIKK